MPIRWNRHKGGKDIKGKGGKWCQGLLHTLSPAAFLSAPLRKAAASKCSWHLMQYQSRCTCDLKTPSFFPCGHLFGPLKPSMKPKPYPMEQTACNHINLVPIPIIDFPPFAESRRWENSRTPHSYQVVVETSNPHESSPYFCWWNPFKPLKQFPKPHMFISVCWWIPPEIQPGGPAVVPVLGGCGRSCASHGALAFGLHSYQTAVPWPRSGKTAWMVLLIPST